MQHVGPIGPRQRACCARCNTAIARRSSIERGNQRAASLAVAALVIYPFAIALPIVELKQFGYASASSIIGGIITLFGDGQWIVASIVLLCSVVFPLIKLAGIAALSTGALLRHHHRALTYKIVELTGRWGMLDVLLVAMLVAGLKIGDLVAVNIGPAAFAFAGVVVLSLFASACFDPHALWQSVTPTAQSATPKRGDQNS